MVYYMNIIKEFEVILNKNGTINVGILATDQKAFVKTFHGNFADGYRHFFVAEFGADVPTAVMVNAFSFIEMQFNKVLQFFTLFLSKENNTFFIHLIIFIIQYNFRQAKNSSSAWLTSASVLNFFLQKILQREKQVWGVWWKRQNFQYDMLPIEHRRPLFFECFAQARFRTGGSRLSGLIVGSFPYDIFVGNSLFITSFHPVQEGFVVVPSKQRCAYDNSIKQIFLT
uniref:LAM_G_DOMAIN domain-containing protein n=1 Tax=Heterorhabditis bacteriophora TaxID=37862 RepID=A0A1I7XC64_HETBA